MVATVGLADQLPDDGQFGSGTIGHQEFGDFSSDYTGSRHLRSVSQGLVNG